MLGKTKSKKKFHILKMENIWMWLNGICLRAAVADPRQRGRGVQRPPCSGQGLPPPPGKNRKIGNTLFKSSYTNFYDFPQLVMTIF